MNILEVQVVGFVGRSACLERYTPILAGFRLFLEGLWIAKVVILHDNLSKIALKIDCDLEQAGVKVHVLLDTSCNPCQKMDTPIAVVKRKLQKPMMF